MTEYPYPDTLKQIFKELNDLSTSNRRNDIPRRIELLQRALEIVSKDKWPDLWGKLHDDLGNNLLDFPSEIRAKNIEKAIHHFEQALQVRNRTHSPREWASTHNNLGNAYCEHFSGGRSRNMEEAIRHYQLALEVRTRKSDPPAWAMTTLNLADAYPKRVFGERSKNIERAIELCSSVLTVYTREAFPYEWAATQNALGGIYRLRVYGSRSENMEASISYFQEALEVFTQRQLSDAVALVQNSLAVAYSERIRGEKAENMERAIGYANSALEVRKRDADPDSWAITHFNLGNAYRFRIRGDPAENIEQAIYHFEQTLQVHTRQMFPLEWARARNHLGSAYLGRLRGGWAENMEIAIQCSKDVLEIYTADAFPDEWAQTQNNLGNAYMGRTYGNPTINVEEAITCYKQALTIRKQEAFPKDWAETQNNLAIAYTFRIEGTRKQNIELALNHFQQALKVYTSDAFPDQCLKTARGLGNLAFEEQRWELATDAFDTAFRAQAILMQAALSRAGKQTELSETQSLPDRAAYAHLQLGEFARAVEVLEQGHAQLLRESLERQRQDLKQLLVLGYGNLYDEYIQATSQYKELQDLGTLKNRRAEELQTEQALEKIQRATDAIRREAGQKYPQYRYFMQALPFAEIQKQVRDRPLVYIGATSTGGFAFIVTDQGVQALELPDLNHTALDKRIGEPSELEWKTTVDDITRWLWDVVMYRLICKLGDNIKSIIMIPSGYLTLLPMHAAWIDDPSKPTQRRYVLDDLNITYAPSAHALWQAYLTTSRPIEKVLVVDNPDSTLAWSHDEVRTLLDLFTDAIHLDGEKATRAAVMEHMRTASLLHFATHGQAGWLDEAVAGLKLADGLLTLPEIYELQLQNAQLAVLSACETGVPGTKLIDEVISLPAGMMQAGVPGVVGSLWIVDDASTALLIKRFYALWLKEGMDPREALQQAQIWLRDSLFESPYNWAAFTYTGVWFQEASMAEKAIGNVSQIARTLIDHLPEEIDIKLRDLIAQAEAGEDTTIEIINLLGQNPTTRAWLKQQLTSLNRKDAGASTPGYVGLAGDPIVPFSLRWVCPIKPKEHWMMVIQADEEPPFCKFDNKRMIRG